MTSYLYALLQSDRAARERRDEGLREADEGLRIDADEDDADDGHAERHLQRGRERERALVRHAFVEIHHADEAHVVVEGDDRVEDPPPGGAGIPSPPLLSPAA